MSKKVSIFLALLATFFIPFYIFRFNFGFVRTNIFEIAAGLAFLSTLFFLYRTKQKITLVSIWPWIFVITALLATAYSDDKIQAIGIVKGWFIIPAIYFWVVAKLFDQKNYQKVAFSLFISVILVSVWALCQKLNLIGPLFYQATNSEISQYLENSTRVFGPFDSPNYLAMFLVPACLLSSPVINIAKKIYWKILIISLYLLPILAVVFSGSRAGIVAVLASFDLIVLIVLIKKKQRLLLWLFGILAALLVIALSIFIFFPGSTKIDSNNARIKIYRYSLSIGTENFVTGIGLGNYQSRIDQISKEDHSFQAYVVPYAMHAHNIFLTIWLNLGSIGLLAFLIILFSHYRKSLAMPKNIIIVASLISMSAILIHGMFDTTYFKNDLSALFWLTFALPYLRRS